MLPPQCQYSLTVVSIVELTVGVMCSCLTSFPGFFRYHLRLLRSLFSFLSSSLRSLHLSRPLNRSSDPSNTPSSRASNTRRLATKDIKMTLGSQVDGRGRFISPASVIATPDWLPLSEVGHNTSTHANNAPEATHREYYEEMAEEQHSRIQYPPPTQDHHSQRSWNRNAFHTSSELGYPKSGRAPKTKQSIKSGRAWWKIHRRSNTTRTGYWDIMSFFRTDVTRSLGQSQMHSESGSSAV